MGILENHNSDSMVVSEALPVSRKSLSPAFRMALLTGAVESVRLHLRSASHIDAADDKGRSALILAASKGHLEICKLLLEAGADPGLKDSEGNDARAAALLQGRREIAALLHGARTQGVAEQESGTYQQLASDINSGVLKNHAVSIAENARVSNHLTDADGLERDADTRAPETDVDPDEAGTFDLSGWQEDIEAPPPPDDPTCADKAEVLQAILSHHVPIDTDENWDDVEIDLPELEYLSNARAWLSDDTKEPLTSLVIAALRDGRVRADQIEAALPSETEIGDGQRAEIEAGLHLVLGDVGTIIDDNFFAPDPIIDVDDDDNERLGDLANDAVNFVGRLLSNEADPLALYVRALPSARLTREEEIALGMVVQEGRQEMLAAITASPDALSRLLSDSEAVLNGELPAVTMLEPPSDTSEQDELAGDTADAAEETAQKETVQETNAELPASEVVAHLTAIIGLCRRGGLNQDGLAQRLFAAGLSSGYLADLEDIASRDSAAESAKDRIKVAQAKAERARKRLVEANLRLVIWVAKRHGGLPLMDRIQEGNIGLMRAADRFDPRIGAKFSSYAVWWIRQSITRAAADAGRIIRLPVHVHESLRKIEKARLQAQYETGREPDTDRIAVLAKLMPSMVRKLMKVPKDTTSVDSDAEVALALGEVADTETPSPDSALMISGTKAAARRHLACLEPREEHVIRLRFGIGCDEHTLEEIGQKYGVTRERIRQIEAKALKKLSHPGRIKRLRDEWQ